MSSQIHRPNRLPLHYAPSPSREHEGEGLRWVKDLPTQPGHYWVRDDKRARQYIILVWQYPNDSTLYAGFEGHVGDPRELSRWTGMLWAGPIPEPTEEA